jgi:hypothetical protein
MILLMLKIDTFFLSLSLSLSFFFKQEEIIKTEEKVQRQLLHQCEGGERERCFNVVIAISISFYLTSSSIVESPEAP